MPTTTYTPLANITLGSSASSVTFSNIPNTYRDLILIVSAVGSSTGDQYFYLDLNTDTGANYSRVEMVGNSANQATSGSFSNLIPVTLRETKTQQILQIMDYSATDKHKTILYRNDIPNSGVVAGAGRWANTAAVTSVRIRSYSSYSMTSGSTLSLYGVIA